VLQQVVRDFGARMDFVPSRAETLLLPASLRYWRPFPDTVAALQRLARKYKLAIISNVDDDLFAATEAQLPVTFADVITAQQAQSYKPDLRNFRLALELLSARKQEVLHAAQSVYHDIAPARQLGIANIWVNRRKGKDGFGATLPAEVRPDLEVPDLATLADLAGV
jgi:2-haloacid dehalogenase